MIEISHIPEQDNEPTQKEKDYRLMRDILNNVAQFALRNDFEPSEVIGIFTGFLCAMIEGIGPEHKQDVINFLEKETKNG